MNNDGWDSSPCRTPVLYLFYMLFCHQNNEIMFTTGLRGRKERQCHLRSDWQILGSYTSERDIFSEYLSVTPCGLHRLTQLTINSLPQQIALILNVFAVLEPL